MGYLPSLSAILPTVRMCEYLTICKPNACLSHLSAYQSSCQARLLEKVDECTTHNPPRTCADDWKGEIEGRRTHVYNIHHIIRYDKVWRNRNLRVASIARPIQKHRQNTEKVGICWATTSTSIKSRTLSFLNQRLSKRANFCNILSCE